MGKRGLNTRGDHLVRQLKKVDVENWNVNEKRLKRVSISLWQDSKPVVVVSSNTDPKGTTTVLRRLRDGSRVFVPCPTSICEYNKYMGGVDLNDQLRGYYHVRLKGRKFYKYIFWFLFDVAVTNAYILAKHHSQLTVNSVKDFRSGLAKSLITDFNGRKRAGRRPSSQPSQKFCTDHFPLKAEKKHRCYFCYHTKKERHETIWHCNTCDKYLCFAGHADNCFLLYHQQL